MPSGSGYGLAPGGYGLDPYGDPVTITGILSANIYSMQNRLRAGIETEIGSLSVMGMDNMKSSLGMSIDSSLNEILSLSVDSVTDENLLSVTGVN
jgi:hypothetical protein